MERNNICRDRAKIAPDIDAPMMVEIPIFGREQGLHQKRRDITKMDVRPVLDKVLIDRLAIGRDDACGDLGMRAFELRETRQATVNIPPDKSNRYDRSSDDKQATGPFG